MKYLVEFHASIERGNAIDEKGGPAALFAHVGQRFKPEAFYGNPTRRQAFLIRRFGHRDRCRGADLRAHLGRGHGADLYAHHAP